MNFSKSYRFLLTVVLLCSFSIYASNVLKVSDTEVKIAKDKVVLKPKIEEASASEAVSYEPMKPIKIEDIERVENLNDTPNNVYSDQEKTDFYNSKNSGVIKIQTNVNIEDNNIDGYSDERRAAKEASRQKVDPEQERAQEKIDYYYNLKLNPPHQDSYDGSRDCADSDAGATDSYGDGCAGYTNSPSWCGGYDDDDFNSMTMCCACGGGADDGQGDLYCPDGDGSAYTWAYTGAYSSEVSWDLVAADASTASVTGDGGSGSFCLADGAYTANMYDSFGDGWDGSVSFYDADGNLAVTIAMGACGYWDEFYGYCDGSAIYADVTFGGPPPVLGCTDATAENFDGLADTDDGTCTWNGGCSSSSYTACDNGDCKPNSYFCDGSSEFGNAGWGPDCSDGSDEGEHCCGSADGGDYSGTDCADLYDCASTWNGSAIVGCDEVCDSGAALDECGVCDGDGSSCACDDLTVVLNDSFGDGWQGQVLSIGSWTGTLAAGSTETQTACIDMTVANDVSCSSGSYDYEVSWSISDAAGTELLAGGAPFAGCMGTGCPVSGCTDANSSNYDSDAVIDDGSCAWYAGMDCAYIGSSGLLSCDLLYCVPASWLGDGGCDSAYFACDAFACDGGDCASDCNGDCGGGVVDDCNGDCGGTAVADDCGVCEGDGSSCSCTSYTVSYDGSYASEVSWSIDDQSTSPVCLEDGTYTLSAFDSYGDCWNGTLSFTDDTGAVVASATWPGCGAGGGSETTFELCFGADCPVGGCLLAGAPEYNPDADYDNGSCTYFAGADYGYWVPSYAGYAIGCGLYYIFPNMGADNVGDDICDDFGYGYGLACDAFGCDGGDCSDCLGDCLGDAVTGCDDVCDSGAAYDECGVCNGNGLSCACDDLRISMTDSWGDSWNGNVLTIGTWYGANDGSTGTGEQIEAACLDLNTAGGLAVTCGGGAYMGEVSWSITDVDSGSVLLEGGAPYTGCLGADCPIFGCTDETADNYNPDAADDDGSCLWNGCPAGYLADCSGDGDCAGANWVGDGFCDGDAQQYGWDGSCYDCDGGDCATDCAGTCEGSAGEDDDCGQCGGGNASYDCAGSCSGDLSAGTWTNTNPGGAVDPSAPITVFGSADDGSWGLLPCVWLESPSTIDNGDGTVTITSVYGADADHVCELASGVFNGVVTTTNVSTHNVADGSWAIVGDIEFTLSNGSNFSVTSTGTFDGVGDDGSLNGSLSGGSSGGAVADECGACDGDGIADGECDCDGSVADECGECGGDGIAEGACDCDGNVNVGCGCDVGFDSSDINLDCLTNVLDVVTLVTAIIAGDIIEGGDINGDGATNVIDVVQLVNLILGGGARATDAQGATIIIGENSLSVTADGYIGGIQMTLSHGNGFELNLTNDALVADYKTSGTTTTFVVVEPNEEVIFTSNQSFEIVSSIIANSNEEIAVNKVSEFGLSAAYPNPFNPSTTVSLSMPSAGHVSVKVYNLVGQVVGVLADGMMEANVYSFTWDANNFSSGVYLIRAESNSSVDIQKVLLVK